MSRPKLSVDDRRALTLAAFSETNRTRLARRYDVTREWLYGLMREAARDPEGKLAEAEKEAEFRRRVKEILDRRQPPQQ